MRLTKGLAKIMKDTHKSLPKGTKIMKNSSCSSCTMLTESMMIILEVNRKMKNENRTLRLAMEAIKGDI